MPDPGPEMAFEVGQTVTVEFSVFNNGPGGANLTDSCVYLESNPNNIDYNNRIDENQSSRLLAGDDDDEDETYTFEADDIGTKYNYC